MGKKTRRSAKTQAKANRQRVEGSLKAANALDNPIEGLDSFLSFDLLADTKSGSLGRDADNSDANATAGSVQSRHAKIRSYRSPLPNEIQMECMSLFEQNMGDMYKASSWGLDLKKKEEELRHKRARFLIVTEEEDDCKEEKGSDSEAEVSPASSHEGGQKTRVLAFCHFRFVPDDDERPKEEVLYLFEIQVHASAQRCGMGRRLMSLMEIVALRIGMRKVMLTVFKSNKSAMGFYLEKMKYVVDDSSPSKFGEDADYEILSKKTQK
mmetsp:Transcript_22259/g.65946  ORF Transcript_22259/g.65946 Transcript_22259/m.65946 type:complete len:267 (-) Transcript_22259:575-1375(-)